MKHLKNLLICMFTSVFSFAQQAVQIPISNAFDEAAPAVDYTNLLNSNLSQFVTIPWVNNPTYSNVVMPLNGTVMLTRLSLYDLHGSFSHQPAYFYARYKGHNIYLGRFEGLVYNQFVDIVLPYGIPADSIIMRKAGRNMPHKVFAYGHPAFNTNQFTAQAKRIIYDTIIPRPFTGMQFAPWLSDQTNVLVQSVHTPLNLQYAEVEIPLPTPTLITSLKLFDWTGVFTSQPATIFAEAKGQRTYLGLFEGKLYNAFVDVIPTTIPHYATSIIIKKFGNNIPQKVQIYGVPLPNDPIDTPVVVMPDHKIPYSHISAELNGQDYTPWLSNSLDSLVRSVWTPANMQYSDVTLHLPQRSRIGSLVLYDHAGIFTTNPATIFLKKDSSLTQVALFEGKKYLVLDTLVLADSIDADAVVVRKYGNNFPQKIWVYGMPIDTAIQPPVDTTIKEVPPSIDTTITLTKIPIHPERLIIMNYAPNGVGELFDSVLNKNLVTGYGKFKEHYEVWYPLDDGEKMQLHAVKMYDFAGTFPDEPMHISLVKLNGERKQIATFTGSRYNTWVGPDPDASPQDPNVFRLPAAEDSFRYIVFSVYKNNMPSEIEFWGTYQAPSYLNIPGKRPTQPLANAVGMNAFEWDFVIPQQSARVLAPTKYAPIKAFTGFRHYLDWQRIENTEGSYSFSPSHWGGWDYDMTYQQCKQDSIEVLVCLQNVPPWMRNTYPEGMQSTDNAPNKYGTDRLQPASYIEKSRAGFQLAARYGRNTQIDLSLIKVNTNVVFWWNPANQVKIGLDLIKYIECDNEANKWWRGLKGYLSPFEYAANLSAFYDGHKGSLGPGTGVKNADSTMQVVMMGMASADPAYVRGMIEWCRMNRGYKPNGSVNICWDVINYHHYANDKNSDQTGQATRGLAPDLSTSESLAKNFMEFSRIYANNMPVWLTEVGYDLHQESPMKAIPIGNKSPLLTQADWNLRTALNYMRAGIDRIFFYELNDNAAHSSTKYNSMGLVDSFFQLRPSGNYLLQMRNLIGKYHYQSTLSTDPVVDVYAHGTQKAYALWIPDETGRTANYTLSVGDHIGVMVYVPQPNSSQMHSYWMNAIDDAVTLPVTETPIFVIPYAELPNFTSGVYKGLYQK